MHNIKLKLAYDGTHYLGWQKTKMGPSIEETLEKNLSRVLQHPINLQAASRTDAGVHAHGQTINFFSSKSIPLDKLQISLNGLLPKDIVVISIEEEKLSFHPSLDCKGKEYHYHVDYGKVQLPIKRLYSWHYPYDLDIDAIRKTIPLLIGQQDFSSFCNSKKNSQYIHHQRNLERIELHESAGKCIQFVIQGDNFLYKMVRNLVGTLIYVGCRKIDYSEIPRILSSHDRTLAGVTAPAHGLFLHQVNY